MPFLSQPNNILRIDGNKGTVESAVRLTMFLLINFLILECGGTHEVLTVTGNLKLQMKIVKIHP